MADDGRVIEFSPFRLDLEAERLWRGGDPVELRPKAWELVCYLAQRPGRLVSKDELMEAVWRDVVVTQASLSQTMAELRQALGDDARNPRFIATVHRRGYRFIASTESARDGGSQAPTPETLQLCGRDRELRWLADRLGAARAGSRQLVFVTGEAGIGKTALLHAFLDGLEPEAGRLFRLGGQCVELRGAAEAYLPLLDAIDRLARTEHGEVLIGALKRFAPTWLTQLPWLLEESEHETSELAGTPARMLRELCVALEELARERPTVLWLEDLHWSDPATVDLLGAFASRPEPARLLVVATYRPVDAAVSDHPIAPLRRSLDRRGACHSLALEMLEEDGVRGYLASRFEGLDEPELTPLLLRHTDGNALFLETMTRYMASREWLAASPDGWRLTAPLQEIEEELPESLRAIVEAQLGRLSDEEVSVLEAGCVAGERFPAQVVAAAVESDVAAAEEVCGRLARWRRFLVRAGTTRWPDGTEGQVYGFLHDVFRNVLYKRLSPARRQQLHRRMARALEEAFVDARTGGAAEIALHFELGGEPLRAIDYLMRAAEGVRLRFADREAVTYLEHALALLGSQPESAESRRREIELRRNLGKALVHSEGYTADGHDVNSRRLIEVASEDGDHESHLVGLAYRQDWHLLQTELDQARELAEESRVIAAGVEDPVPKSHFLTVLLMEAEVRGEHERATTECDRFLELIADVDPRDLEAAFDYDLCAFSMCFRAWACWFLGRPDDAREWAAAARKRAIEEGTTVLGIAIALTLSISIEHFCRDREAAEELDRELTAYLEEYGLAWPYAFLGAAEGWLAIARGDADGAVARLREGLAGIREARATQVQSLLLGTLAEAELALGRIPEATRALDEALEFAERTGERFWEAEIHRLRGEVQWVDGEETTAEQSFREALAVAYRQGALSLELRGAISLARLLREAGQGAEGRALLSEVYSRFEQGFDTADLREARALLGELGPSVPAR